MKWEAALWRHPASHPMLLQAPSQLLGGPRMLYVPMASVPLNVAFPPRTAIASSLLGRANSLSAQVLARHHPFWEALAISSSLEAFPCSLLMLHAHSYCDKSMFFWDLCSGWSLSLDHMLFQVRSLLPLNAQGTSRLHTQCLTLCVQVPIEWSYS